MAFDAGGMLYVADSANHTIRMISRGMVVTLAGSPASMALPMVPAERRFFYPVPALI